MAHQSYTKTVLDKALELASAGNNEVHCGDVAKALSAKSRVERKRCLNTLSELAIDGKLNRIRQGVYSPVSGLKKLDKREVMWRLLRMRRRITVEDLIEMAEVRPVYAREWLQMLVKHEVVRKIQPQPGKPAVWILIKDTKVMPVDEEKAAKLRALRKKQAAITEQLGVIDQALSSVRNILQTMEE